MEFIFIKTQELKEFEQDITNCIKFIKRNAFKTIAYSFLFYLMLASLIILLP